MNGQTDLDLDAPEPGRLDNDEARAVLAEARAAETNAAARALVAGQADDAPTGDAPDDPEDRLVEALAPDELEAADYDEGTAEYALAGVTVGDLDTATWAARKAHRLRVRIADVRRLADDQAARARAWADAETERMARDLAFFEGRLRGSHEHALAEDPKHAKTIRLPDGTELRSQAGKLAVSVVDVPALVAWAEANECAEELLKYPDPTPIKAELSKRFDGKAAQEDQPGTYPAVDATTGEVIPGVEIERKPRTFTIAGPA